MWAKNKLSSFCVASLHLPFSNTPNPLLGIHQHGQLSMLNTKLKWVGVTMENHSTLHHSWDCVKLQPADLQSCDFYWFSAKWLLGCFFFCLNYLSFLICHTAPSINIQTSSEAINWADRSVNSIILSEKGGTVIFWRLNTKPHSLLSVPDFFLFFLPPSFVPTS